MQHIYDIADWTLEPEEVDRLLRRPLWDHLWENADEWVARLRALTVSDQLSEPEKEKARAILEQFEAVLGHKRDMESL